MEEYLNIDNSIEISKIKRDIEKERNLIDKLHKYSSPQVSCYRYLKKSSPKNIETSATSSATSLSSRTRVITNVLTSKKFKSINHFYNLREDAIL